MSRCDVKIDFQRPSREFVAGELVEGVVTLRADKDIDPRRVVLKRYWETHGKGNRSSESEPTIVLDTDAHLRAGEDRTYPFSFTAPQGPPTYHGHHLNVDHYVEVEVDLAWARDPKAKEDFVLRGGPSYSGPRSPITPWANKLKKTKRMEVAKKAWSTPEGVVSNLMGLTLILALFVVPIFIFVPPLGFFLVLLGIVGLVKWWMLNSRIGDIMFAVQPLLVRSGESFVVDVSFRAKKATDLRAVSVVVKAEERCTRGSGTIQQTLTHTVFESEHSLIGGRRLRANEEVRASEEVHLGDTEAYSFAATDNSLTWSVAARIEIPNWPDWFGEQRIVVAPAIPQPPDGGSLEGAATLGSQLEEGKNLDGG